MRYEKTIEKRPCGILWNLLPISKKHDVTSLNSEPLVCPIYIKINSLTIMNYELSWTLSFQTAPKLSCWVVCTHPNISIRIPTIHKSFQSSQPIIPSLVRNNNLKTWNLPSQGCWNIPPSRPWKQRNWPHWHLHGGKEPLVPDELPQPRFAERLLHPVARHGESHVHTSMATEPHDSQDLRFEA